MAKFSTNMQSTINAAAKTASCINAYNEYVKSQITKISDWIANAADTDYVSLACDTISSKFEVFALKKKDYTDIINGVVNSIDIVNGDGTTYTASAEMITEAFNDQLSEMRMQSLFFDYCTNAGENLSTSDFLTQVKTMFDGAVPTMIDKYNSIVSRANDAVEAFYSFFDMTKTSPTHTVNHYIEINDGSQYEGSVWTCALTTITNQITGFFEGCWQGIQHLDVFFQKIIEGAGKLIKWALTKMFKQLATVYEVVGKDPTQMMDLPLIQVNFGSNPYALIQSGLTTASDNTGYLYGARLDNVRTNIHKTFTITDPTIVARCGSSTVSYKQVVGAFVDECTKQTVDGTTYSSIMDISIPSDPFNFVLRFGRTHNNEVVMTLHACFTKGLLDQATDDQINQYIYDALLHIIEYTINDSINWSAPGYFVDHDHTSYKCEEAMYKIMTYPTANTELYDLIKNHMFNVNYSTLIADYSHSGTAVTCTTLEWVNALVLYAATFGRPFGNTQKEMVVGAYEIYDNPYSHYEDPPDPFITWDDVYDSTTDPLITGFKPYQKDDPIPYAIHYQNTQDRADEIVKLFWGAVIAIATVIVVAKICKWSKNRKEATHLAQSAMDSFAWQYADNPTPENLAKYRGARKKYRKMNAVNKILGLASSSSDVSSLVLPQLDSSEASLMTLLKGPSI